MNGTTALSNATRLLIAVGGVAAKPGLLKSLAAGTHVQDTLKRMAAQPPPGLAGLADELAAASRATLDGFARDLPADADVLYEQMVLAGLPDTCEIVAANMNAAKLSRAMRAKLSAPEHLNPPMPDLFEAMTVQTLTRLLCRRAFADELTPAFMAEVLDGLDRDAAAPAGVRAGPAEADATVRDLLDRKGGAAAALADLEGLTRDELDLLATPFGVADAADRGDADLREVLADKAKEYRALRAALAALKDCGERPDNLSAATLAALDAMRIEQVERLLADAQEIATGKTRGPVERNAELTELQARGALLRGDAEAASLLLSAAADSFAGLDPQEPALRRLSYEDLLYTHGLRYGGSGLALAGRMIRKALERIDKHATPHLWAGAQNNLGIALRRQGNCAGGADGIRLLAEAVAAYREALSVSFREAYPADWAVTQNNLGRALRRQGTRTGGTEGTRLSADAVVAFRNALTVTTREAHPVDWAATRNNLGKTLAQQGSHTEGEDGIRLLAEAVAAFRDALAVRTRDAHPSGWAATQTNLGAALKEQGTRTGGEDGIRLLTDAVAAYRDALCVTTRAAHPVPWAETQVKLALAALAIAEHEATGDPAPHLRAALAHVEASLEVFDPTRMAFYHGKAAALRDAIRARLAGGG